MTELDDLEIGPSGAELHLAVVNLARDLARDWNIELGCTRPDDPVHGFALHPRPAVPIGFWQGRYLAGLRDRLRVAGIDTDLRDERKPGSWVIRWSRHPAAKALEQFVGAMRAAGWTVDLGENGEAEVTPPPDYESRWRNASIEQKLPRALGTVPQQRADLPALLKCLADLGIHVQYGKDGWLVATPGESIVTSKWKALCAALDDTGVQWAVTVREGNAQAHVELPVQGSAWDAYDALLDELRRQGVGARVESTQPWTWRLEFGGLARAGESGNPPHASVLDDLRRRGIGSDPPGPFRADPDVGNAQVRVTTGINDEGQRETFVELSHEGQCRDFLADLLAGHAARLHDRNEDRAEPRPEDQPDFYGDDVPDDGPTGVQCVWEGCSRTAVYCKEHAIEMADYRSGVLRSPKVLEAKIRAYEAFVETLDGQVGDGAVTADTVVAALDMLNRAVREAARA